MSGYHPPNHLLIGRGKREPRKACDGHPRKRRPERSGRIERSCVEEENFDRAGASRARHGIEDRTDAYGDPGLLERFAGSGSGG